MSVTLALAYLIRLHMLIEPWSSEERVQVVAAGVAPFFVSLAVAGVVYFQVGGEAFVLFAALLPFSYATLVFFVLPSLWLLRWSGRGTFLSFVSVCGLASTVPWLVLSLLLFPAGTGKYSGAPINVLAILALPAVFSAAAGAIVHRLGNSGARRSAAP